MHIRKTALALLLVCGLASRVQAAPTVPNTFTAGTPARAADVNANFEFVMGQIAAGMPTGTVLPFAGATAPAGFLLCDGSEASRTTHAALFAVIGTTFGPGDGSTTFNLPDLRGQFLRGLDDMGTAAGARGIDAGRALGSGQLDALQGHEHYDGFAGANSTSSFGVSTAGVAGNLNTQNGTSTANHANTSGPITDGTNGTPRTAAETRPRNVALNFIIRA